MNVPEKSRPDVSAFAEIVDALAKAKSRQDIGAAMAVYHPQCVLEAPPFGSRHEGSERIRAALEGFFSRFPDYEVTLEGQAIAGETFVSWGLIHVTLTGQSAGQTANGKRATVPVFILFRFRDSRVVWESFNFDLASLCRQSGVTLEAFSTAAN
jgi:ketosteroid isomerase-like protein